MAESNWAFKARIPRLETSIPDPEEMERKSRRLMSIYDWEPWEAKEEEPSPATDIVEDNRSVAERRFLLDLADERYQFSPITQRWERCGVRSVSDRQAVLNRLLDIRLVRCENLSVGRGAPIKLCELTAEGWTFIKAKPFRKGRGSLRVRAATYFLLEKLRK